MEKKAVIYGRVSTIKEEQTQSLSTQKEELNLWAVSNGYTVIGEFEDRCSGREMDCREGLLSALQMANQEGATILITEISRFSRSVEHIAGLMNQNVKFIATRSGRHLSKEMILILAVFAESESDTISRRVSRGIQAEFLRNPEKRSEWGGGSPDRLEKSIEDLTQGRIMGADEFAMSKAGELATYWRIEKGMTLQEIAHILQASGITTARGKTIWRKTTVQRVVQRRLQVLQKRGLPLFPKG
mgnify:CR=1 FL=1